MVMINTIKVIRYIIMYTYSILLIPPPFRSFCFVSSSTFANRVTDGITAQHYTVFNLTFNIGFFRLFYYIPFFDILQEIFYFFVC